MTIRETAQAVVAAMEGADQVTSPDTARHFKNFAIIDYAQALKNSPNCSPEDTAKAIEKAYLYADRAIQCGMPEERMEQAFRNLRNYWLPRLVQSTHGLNSKRDARLLQAE